MVRHPLWRPYAPRANADRQLQRLGRRQVRPGPLEEPGECAEQHWVAWTTAYEELRQRIEAAVPDQVVQIAHVGSTSIRGLVAKPVIDIDLTVPDVADEPAYLNRLELVGFRMIFRDDLAGDPHRQLTFAVPNANLHVWSPGAVEPQRHLLLRHWLLTHPEDRELYAGAKLRAASQVGDHYNDAKSAVIYDIYERALAADPAYPHDPQPRAGESTSD